MMRSMFTGVSGLRTHQTKMDVIANNIANVNTTGFKSSRVTFNEVFSQTVGGATRANEATGRGGTNPQQIGLGVNVSSIDKMMSTGAAQRTDRAMDLMINGDGFFIVGDESGQYFTRAGAIDMDADGNLVIGNGMKVYGWDAVKDTDGTMKITKTSVTPLQISGDKEFIDPSATEKVRFKGNLNALAIGNSVTKSDVKTMSIFDSLGNRYTMDVTFKYDEVPGSNPPEKEWTYSIGSFAYPDNDRDNPIQIDPDYVAATPPALPTTGDSYSGKLTFDAKGELESMIDANGTTIYDKNAAVPGSPKIMLPVTGQYTDPVCEFGASNGVPGNPTFELDIDFGEITQHGSATTLKAETLDGSSRGEINGLSVGNDGVLTASYTNGLKKIVGQIPVAIFKNPAGLESYGQNLFRQTANSGDFDGTGQESSNILGGVLEMSNVDLSSEFTEMITTQRGFQASSRLITTSDDMIQELVNLKR